jgi:hypothetical protein
MSGAGKWRIGPCLVLAVAISGDGCSRSPARIEPANIDPMAAGAAAVSAYDQDGDGGLSNVELKKCPALLSALAVYDANKDGKISAEEIASRLESWEATRVGITAAPLYVRLDGRPLTGAEVLLEPEPFLEGAVMPARAEINSSGLASPSIAAEHLPNGVRFGLQVGLYKIKISHPTRKIPAKYNEQTELGLEVQPNFDIYHPTVFELTSK